jgi:hypothetical protein
LDADCADQEEERQDGDENYDMLHCVEKPSNFTMKDEPNDNDFDRLDSPATLAASSNISPQAKQFVRSPYQVPSEQPSRTWSSPVFVDPDIGYTADYEETQPSPSLRRREVQSLGGSKSYSPKIWMSNSLSVNRVLDFGTPTTKRGKKSPKRTEGNSKIQKRTNKNLYSLENLRNIERSPAHRWSDQDRETLCVLYRYYQASDPTTIPIIFNAVRDLDLEHRKVQSQFHNICLYGPRAYPAYRKVFSTPFSNSQAFQGLHMVIQNEARNTGIVLERRDVEPQFRCDVAKYSKSPTIRKQYKTRVRIASQEDRKIAGCNDRKTAGCNDRKTAGYNNRRVDGHNKPVMGLSQPADEYEVWTDAEDAPEPKVAQQRHRLAFRTWCDKTRQVEISLKLLSC